jgi:hypothetical protein
MICTQKRSPTFSSDMKRPENMDCWVELFSTVEPILHSINHVADCVDFFTMRSYRKLKQKVMDHKKDLPGGFMGIHLSHWLNIGVHANQLPSKPHRDGLSSHKGLDGICSIGPYGECWICFPHLGIRFRIRPLDVVLVRGAALFHHMYRWNGEGRFVIVPFADRHLFPTFRVKRPKFPGSVFGADWKEFRTQNPAKDLGSFQK